MINKHFLQIIGCILLFAIVSCKKESATDLTSEFKYSIPPVKLTSSARVGAYYFNYTSTDWAKVQPDTSLLGKPYNVLTDATIMPKQLTWADEGGVDYFIMKWNNGSTDNTLLNTFVSARTSQSVKMVISYNTAHLSATNASPLVGTKLVTMLNEFKTLVQNYLSKDFYYKIDNRPVILLTPLNLSSSALTSIDYKYVTDTLRVELKKVGIDPFIIGELTTGWTAPANFSPSLFSGMDAVVLTNWNTADYDRWWAFYSYNDLNWKNWKTTLEAMNVEYAPCIFPGYNEPNAPTQRILERTDENYTDYCNVAKRNMGKNRLVIINSWNDFSKGTALEPSVKYKKQFLEITKREFKVP
ncbi:MAG: hypothetical protein EOP48_00815 [Sphingobacteriales bacterium]|nr:MAG: hypothetical protein EOP48_00815 [Sphingobacteriales bacterium]